MMSPSLAPQLGRINALVRHALDLVLAVTLDGYRQLANVNLLVLAQSPEHAARTLQAVGGDNKTERAATKQQKAEGRRNTSPVLLPLTAGDGRLFSPIES